MKQIMITENMIDVTGEKYFMLIMENTSGKLPSRAAA